VALSVADLQEMVNALRTELDAGLAELHAEQGRNGLPAAPPSSMGPTQSSGFSAPQAEPSVEAMIASQRQEALLAEKQAVQSAFGSGQ
jgi:hypothetical protein